MTNSKGLRRGTRDMFSRPFRKKGTEHLSTYLRVYKVGNLVDIKGNGAFQKGMPHKSYHGRTGRVFNVSHQGLGVIVNKQVRGKVLAKKIYIRIEHVRPSKCRDDFLARRKRNEELKRKSKETGVKYDLKRHPKGPRKAHLVNVSNNKPIFLTPLPYEFII